MMHFLCVPPVGCTTEQGTCIWFSSTLFSPDFAVTHICNSSLSAGTSIDQGIAYVLMLVALVLTYLIHPLDASSPYKLF
jgi:hypothetical protein